MKVLLISHYPPPAGGIASWTKRLLSIGLPNGWNVAHINLNTINGRDPFKNPKRNFKDEYVRTKNIWKKEIQFLKEDKEISVVHTCIPCTPFGILRETVTGCIAKLYKKRFILHCRCTVPNVVNSFYKVILFKILAHFCDGIMVLNQKSVDFCKKHSRAYVELIPNFVTKEELAFSEKKDIRCSIKDVVYAGGVTPEKGCDTILQAAEQLPEMQFHLVGIVSKEIAQMNHPQNVIFYGNREKDEVNEIISKGDVFLFLSRYWGEGFSNALVEGMAAGLPCVVTDWAANADMIEDGGGRVVQKQDVNALVNALTELSKNVDFRRKASVWNVEKVKRAYVAEVVLKQYTDFYEKILRI